MKYIYSFKEGNKDMRELLGGKGANLCEMTNLGLPIPKGFIVSTDACINYYNNNMNIDKKVLSELDKAISDLEIQTGKKFGDKSNPLLVSVRSGARSSMPGMMDTVLNLGLNDEIAMKLSQIIDERFVYDCYRRFITMYSDVVMNFNKDEFEKILEDYKKDRNIKLDIELTTNDLKKLVLLFKAKYHTLSGTSFPDNPKEQLKEAIMAVFRSWNNDRAKYYRKINNIPDEWGTAVNIQEMVYGNLNNKSGTGVLFSRNPSTGENELFGEYLMNAQGEDIVAGTRTPNSINDLKDEMPDIYQELFDISKKMEQYYKDMQDMEFTIENGKLYILQTRNGKRTGKAAIKIAVEMVKERLITKEEAISRITTSDIEGMLHPTFNSDDLKEKIKIASGIAASPGAGSGKVYFNAEDVIKAYDAGERDIVLVRLETSAEDIEGMNKSKAVVTIRGGMTSHAAVVARTMGTPCVSGCEGLSIDEKSKVILYENGNVKEGDIISVDGTNGNVYLGKIETTENQISKEMDELLKYISEISKISVRANADNKEDAEKALSMGAKGIGLCRTEHMFFKEERIFNFRKMILADNQEEREEALNKILPYQKDDFIELFKVMNGFPVTIRLLDPPLHEFLPKNENEIYKLALDLNASKQSIKSRIEQLKEFNPMMGHRGVRLGITYPEIIEMQTKAIFEAMKEVQEEGIKVIPEIMVPLVGVKEEINYVKEIVQNVYEKTINKPEKEYKIGTMIEVPRAALIADSLAEKTDFFSFGTNDLTQMTYGFSRDDAGKFLTDYYNKNILDFNPFEQLDIQGVGSLIKEAIAKARKINKDMEFGVCGEQGANKESIRFLSEQGIDYVSCSPYRIPSAMLACAKAAIDK